MGSRLPLLVCTRSPRRSTCTATSDGRHDHHEPPLSDHLHVICRAGPSHCQELRDLRDRNRAVGVCIRYLLALAKPNWQGSFGLEDQKLWLNTNILLPQVLRPDYWNSLAADQATISQNRSIHLIGPWFDVGALSQGAFVSRYSVFLHNNGNWSFPNETGASVCPPELCNAPDGTSFWGFVNCVFTFKLIAQGLEAVKAAGLRYTLKVGYESPNPALLDSNYNITASDDLACTSVDFFGWLSWNLCVAVKGGWTPNWAPALYAGVALLSVLISVLVFFSLRSRKLAIGFLDKQIKWNQEQKVQSKLLQKALGSLEKERDNQLSLLREILPEMVVSVFLTRLDHTNITSDHSSRSPSEASSRMSFSGTLSTQDVMDLATAHDQVTILFADIKGFTTMSSTLHPSQVMLMLNDLFSHFDAILEEHDVYKVETIGDCYMAVTGLFGRDAGDEEEGADGLEMLAEDTGARSSVMRMRAMQRRDGGWGKLGGRDGQHACKMLGFAQAINRLAANVQSPIGSGTIEMRVGLHSGPVHSGVVGRKMPRFCLFGDTELGTYCNLALKRTKDRVVLDVNTASRMESNGEAGRIHVSAATAALLQHEDWEERTIDVKGKGEMKTYFHSQSKKDE